MIPLGELTLPRVTEEEERGEGSGRTAPVTRPETTFLEGGNGGVQVPQTGLTGVVSEVVALLGPRGAP